MGYRKKSPRAAVRNIKPPVALRTLADFGGNECKAFAESLLHDQAVIAWRNACWFRDCYAEGGSAGDLKQAYHWLKFQSAYEYARSNIKPFSRDPQPHLAARVAETSSAAQQLGVKIDGTP